ncbi:MAG TPA: phosphatidate cytidylyltransferase, partial [Flavobacteriales bacterium]|nr:phosphatidate cytidylyltransferase [Flavobacteriales bacterium]
MKALLTRSISGLLFAAIMLLGIWYSRWSFTILFFIINLGCLWEYYTITKPLYTIGKISHNFYRSIGIILGSIIYIFFAARSMLLLPEEGEELFVIVLYLFMMLELFSLSPQAIRNAALNVFGLVYISTALGLLLLITQRVYLFEDAYDWYPMMVAPVLGLLLLIWANDTFAYLGGSLFGRNKLYAA